MTDTDHTRREFLVRTSVALGGSWLALNLPAIRAAALHASEAQQQAAFEVFTPQEARTFAAFAARVFPTDTTPGAAQAGVDRFADRALGTFAAPFLPLVRPGLAELDVRARRRIGGREGFASLTARRQDAVMRGVEQTEWFFLARLLVVLGMFSHPSHGGNRDRVGWQLIGFEDRGGYQPPFGYYDAEYARQAGEV